MYGIWNASATQFRVHPKFYISIYIIYKCYEFPVIPFNITIHSVSQLTPLSTEFLACFSENEVPPRASATTNMKIIFHKLVDRFSRRPRFPAAPRPNYCRLAISHRGDSKKTTRLTPTHDGSRRRPAPASIFIKTQRPTAHVPLVPAAVPRGPHPSSPSRFLRDVGAATGWGAATARTQNIDHWKKSRRIAVISRNRVPAARVPLGARRSSSACGLGR